MKYWSKPNYRLYDLRESYLRGSNMKLGRRSLLQAAAIAAGAGIAGWTIGGRGIDAWAGQAPPSVPDDVLNPVEVHGPEAVPIIGQLPGARRMYVLPDGQGGISPRWALRDDAYRAAHREWQHL